MHPPAGTITFLFTDIEGSTKLWERCPDAMRPALARHDALLRGSIERKYWMTVSSAMLMKIVFTCLAGIDVYKLSVS